MKVVAMKVSCSACAAEVVAMALFVIIGCGSAMGVAGEAAWMLEVALTFGLAITTLAYAVGHYSGGHINCAVTFGLVLAGYCEWAQGLANLFAQLLGAVLGAALLLLVFPKGKDMTGGLGTNAVAPGFEAHNAFIGELLMTLLLVFVVLETACSRKSVANRAQACVAIGLAVFVAHVVLLPIDGCSINPTRSFGPAVVATIRDGSSSTAFDDMWIFWIGPLVGAALAAGLHRGMLLLPPKEADSREAETGDVEESRPAAAAQESADAPNPDQKQVTM